MSSESVATCLKRGREVISRTLLSGLLVLLTTMQSWASPNIILSTGFEAEDGFVLDDSGFTGGIHNTMPAGQVWSSGRVGEQYNAIWNNENNTPRGKWSAVLGNQGQYMTVDLSGHDGVGTVSFQYTSYTRSSDAEVRIQWTTDKLDGSEQWHDAGSYRLLGLDPVWTTKTVAVNQPGDVKIRWYIASGQGGSSIDNVEITEYTNPFIARAGFEASEGFFLSGSLNQGFEVISTLDNALWRGGVAGQNYTAVWDNDSHTGSQSALIGNNGQYLFVNPEGGQGVGSVTFSHRSYTNSSNATISLQWTRDIIDGTEQWIEAGSYREVGIGDWAEKTFRVDQPGDIKLRWIVDGSGGSSIDDVQIRPYGGERTKVAAVGDSITWGYGIDDRVQNAYPSQLQTLLGDQWHVGNFGRSGARVAINSANPYYGSPEYQQALEFSADVVVIALGINDCSVGEAGVIQ